jgi:hypothetical protein
MAEVAGAFGGRRAKKVPDTFSPDTFSLGMSPRKIVRPAGNGTTRRVWWRALP